MQKQKPNMKLSLHDAGYIVSLKGNEYVTHAGLLWLAHEHGLKGVTVSIVSWDPEARQAVMTATATGERGTFTDIGDADPSNVGRMIATACLRMASTRASSRALRLYCGVGMTCQSELPASDKKTEAPAAKKKKVQKTAEPAAKKVQKKAEPVHKKPVSTEFHPSTKAFRQALSQVKPKGSWDYPLVEYICASLNQPAPCDLSEDRQQKLLQFIASRSPAQHQAFIDGFREYVTTDDDTGRFF